MQEAVKVGDNRSSIHEFEKINKRKIRKVKKEEPFIRELREQKEEGKKREGRRDVFLDICNFYFYPIETNVKEILFFDRWK